MTRDRAGQLAAPVAQRMQLQAAMITSTWIVLAAVAADIAGVLPLPARAARVAPREPAEHVVQ